MSEFAGSAEVFQGNELAINPWDYKQMARAINHALRMNETEKKSRYLKLSERVAQRNGLNWVSQMQTKLDVAYEMHKLKDTMSIPRLSVQSLCEAYYQAPSALLILDYEGTLQPLAPSTKGALTSSPQRLVDILTELVNMQGNNVYITSARTKVDMERLFFELPGLGLVAENGCFVRPCGSEHWVDLVDTSPATTAEWKEGVLSLLSYYKDRQKGSWIEEKECTIIYHYANAPANEAEAALKQAGDAANHINDSCQGQRMRAIPLDKAIIIEPSDVDKATAAEWILHHTYNYASDKRGPDENPDLQDVSYFQAKNDIVEHPGLTTSLEHLSVTQADEIDSTAVPTQDTPPSVPKNLSHPTVPPPSVSSNSDPQAIHPTWPSFLLVAGDDREDEPLFRWANTLQEPSHEEGTVRDDDDAMNSSGGKRTIREVFSVCVGKKNTEASCTLTQGAMGMVAALLRLVGT